jgi:hypothetical protein
MSLSYIPVELRRSARERAHQCCEYCLIPEAATLAVHQIDHVVALSARIAKVFANSLLKSPGGSLKLVCYGARQRS